MTCSYGQWVGQKPYCDPGGVHIFHTQLFDAFSSGVGHRQKRIKISVILGKLTRIFLFQIVVYCPYPGTIENGQILLVGVIGKYEYRSYVKRIGHNDVIEYQCSKVSIVVFVCVESHFTNFYFPFIENKYKFYKLLSRFSKQHKSDISGIFVQN